MQSLFCIIDLTKIYCTKITLQILSYIKYHGECVMHNMSCKMFQVKYVWHNLSHKIYCAKFILQNVSSKLQICYRRTNKSRIGYIFIGLSSIPKLEIPFVMFVDQHGAWGFCNNWLCQYQAFTFS